MKLLWFFLSLFIPISLFAGELNSIIKPSALKELNWQKSFSRKDATQTLGKAQLHENNTDYYSIAGIKYPLSIEYKKDKVSRIYAMMVNQKISLQKITPYIKDFQRSEAKGKEQELYYYLVSPDKKLKLKFSLIDDSLYSVERWY